jgi:hypothetical protein
MTAYLKSTLWAWIPTEFFQGLAGFSGTKSVAHAAALDIYFSKDLQN